MLTLLQNTDLDPQMLIDYLKCQLYYFILWCITWKYSFITSKQWLSPSNANWLPENADFTLNTNFLPHNADFLTPECQRITSKVNLFLQDANYPKF